jgi:hypothetical protein
LPCSGHATAEVRFCRINSKTCPRGECTGKPMRPRYGVRSEDQQHATTSTDWTNQQVIHASGDRSRRGWRRCVYRQNLVSLTRALVVGVGDTPSCHAGLSITAPSTLTCRREGRRAPRARQDLDHATSSVGSREPASRERRLTGKQLESSRARAGSRYAWFSGQGPVLRQRSRPDDQRGRRDQHAR